MGQIIDVQKLPSNTALPSFDSLKASYKKMIGHDYNRSRAKAMAEKELQEERNPAYPTKMGADSNSIIKGPNPNSSAFKAGGKYDVNSLQNKWK